MSSQVLDVLRANLAAGISCVALNNNAQSHLLAAFRGITQPLTPLKRAAAPLALIGVVVHLLLTAYSWRYGTATLSVLDISPSMALACLALVYWGPSLQGCGSKPKDELNATNPSYRSNDSRPASRQQGSIHPTQTRQLNAHATGQSHPVHTAGMLSAGRGLPLLRVLRKFASSAKARIIQAAEKANIRHQHEGLRRQATPPKSQASSCQGSNNARDVPMLSRGMDRFWPGRGRSSEPHVRDVRDARAARWPPTASMPVPPGGPAVRHQPRSGLQTDGDTASTITASVTSRQHSAVAGGGAARSQQAAARDNNPSVPHTGLLAVDCLGADCTLPAFQEITQVVTQQHLLQFGSLLGESSAELALSQAGAPAAQGSHPGCLLGATDNPQHFAQGWELVCAEACAQRGLHYQAWRRYLRKGLFMYMSRTVFEGVTPSQLAAFQFDNPYKVQWDEASIQLQVIPPVTATTTLAATRNGLETTSGTNDWEMECMGRSAYLYARSKFPGPMAQREYIYARRVWAKADDGGCYMLSRAAQHPCPPSSGGRVVRITDFMSGTVIRESAMGSGNGVASEIVTVYFEDSQVSAGFVNLGVRKALWPMVQRMEAALRAYVNTPKGANALAVTCAALRSACANGGHAVVQDAVASSSVAASSIAGSTAASARSIQSAKSKSAVASQPQGSKSSGEAVKARKTVKAAGDSTVENSLAKVLTSVPMLVWQCHRGFMQLLASAGRVVVVVKERLWVMARWTACGLGLVGLQRRLWKMQRTLSSGNLMKSHPVEFGDYNDRGRGSKRRWGKRLATRLALVAVRAVGLPLVHRVLNRSSSQAIGFPSSSRLSRQDSISSHGRDTTRGIHSGRAGSTTANHATTMRASTARVMNWLDPACGTDYLLGQHPELLSLQQMQQRKQLSNNTMHGNNLASKASRRLPSGLVVDGVALALDRPDVGTSNSSGSMASQANKSRGGSTPQLSDRINVQVAGRKQPSMPKSESWGVTTHSRPPRDIW